MIEVNEEQIKSFRDKNNNKVFSDLATENKDRITELDEKVDGINANLTQEIFEINDNLTQNYNGLVEDLDTLSNIAELNTENITNLNEVVEIATNNISALTGDVENVSGELDVINQQLSNIPTRLEVEHIVSQIQQFRHEKVTELPTTGNSCVMYLIPKQDNPNVFEEYIWLEDENRYEDIGSTAIDLTGYVQETDYANSEKAGVVKVNTNNGIGTTNGDIVAIQKTLQQYQNSDNNLILGKGTNEAIRDDYVKRGIVSSTIQLSDDEKQSAKTWLGIDIPQNISDLNNDVGYLSEHQSLSNYVTKIELITAIQNKANADFSNITGSYDFVFMSQRYGDGESGYVKWKNGRLEQWGVATTNSVGETEFTIHQPYKDERFSIFIEPREQGNFFHYAIPSGLQKFRCRITASNGAIIGIKVQWRSFGYWK